MTKPVSLLVNALLPALILVGLSMGCQQREFTLAVTGDDEADGAGVFVNGRSVGTMAKQGEQAPQFVMTFSKGTLTVEVKKDGYLPFLEVITVTSNVSEQQLHVKLARDTTTEQKTTEAPADQPRRPSGSSNSKLPVCPD